MLSACIRLSCELLKKRTLTLINYTADANRATANQVVNCLKREH